MDDLTLNLIVLSATFTAAGLIFFFVRRSQASNEKAIRQMALEKGWTVETLREPLAWGLRLTTRRWTLEALSRSSGKESGPGSSDISMQTTWRADAPGLTLLIGERNSHADLGIFGDMAMRQILQTALGKDADGLKEIQAGSEAFRQKFMLWAQNPDAFRPTSAFESALLNWKGPKPLIKRTSEGLTIELRGVHLKKIGEIGALVQLGEMLL